MAPLPTISRQFMMSIERQGDDLFNLGIIARAENKHEFKHPQAT
ncbi:hypothetical protein [Shewanella sp.]|nr:hypothetical protein [Shewanella sp.]